jgi:hypothetical protein
MAENCLLAQPIERLLWRKPPLKSDFSAAENDPQRTVSVPALLGRTACVRRHLPSIDGQMKLLLDGISRRLPAGVSFFEIVKFLETQAHCF